MAQVYVSTQHRQVVVPDSGVVSQAAPPENKFEVAGRKLIRFDHNEEVTIALNKLGFECPAPALYYYKFSRPPFEAQRDTVRLLTLNPRAFVLNSMGTGKTLSCLWAWDWLNTQGETKKLLVVAPLSTLTMVWAREVFSGLRGRTCAVLHGSKARRVKILKEDHDIYIINHDGIKVMYDELAAKAEITSLVIDESTAFKDRKSDRSKTMKKLANLARMKTVWGLTGTPTPNAPTDAWGQVNVVNPKRCPTWFSDFRAETMHKVTAHKFVAKPDANDKVFKLMQPAVRWKRDDCYDLPETMYSDYEVQLSAEQKRGYDQMMKTYTLEYAEGKISAMNEAVKVSKLLQIAGGFAYDNEKVVRLKAGDRLNVALEVTQEAEGKVLLFCPYKQLVADTSDFLTKHGVKNDVITGDVTKKQRDVIFNRFQGGSTLKAIVAHPATMSHGLNLTEANTIVWVLPYPSLETYEQANARITRPGQTLKTHIVHLIGSPIEQRIITRLKSRARMQGMLLDMFGG